MPASIYDATDNDVWPDARERPPLAMREEIRRIARIEVTEEDIESLGFVPWYAKFYVAEQRVRARMDAAKAALPAPPSAPAADPEELQQLRRRVATLEKMVLGEKAILLKVVGRAIGLTHKAIDGKIKAVADAAPVPLPLPDWNNPTVHYCGLWNSKSLYGPGAMVTCNGAGWIAMSAMGAGVKPGVGETGWRLAVKSDTASLRAIVKDEVTRQLKGARR